MNKKYKTVNFIGALTLIFGLYRLVNAQIKKDKFAAEAQKILQNRRGMKKYILQNANKTISDVQLPDEDPGTTGLKFVDMSVKANNVPKIDVFNSLCYSELKKPIKANESIKSDVVSFDSRSSKNSRFSFEDYLNVDPGYISDPTPTGYGEKVILKCGRYLENDACSLYEFDEKSNHVTRVTSARLWNNLILTSVNGRYLAYVVGGNYLLENFGKGPRLIGDNSPARLWIWDSQTRKNMKITETDWVQVSYYWRSSNQLIYSHLESQNNTLVPVSFSWDASKNETRELMRAQSPVFSPDSKLVIYCAAIDENQSFSAGNSTYFLKNTLTGNVQALGKSDKGKYYPHRQTLWSADSKHIFSVLNREMLQSVACSY